MAVCCCLHSPKGKSLQRKDLVEIGGVGGGRSKLYRGQKGPFVTGEMKNSKSMCTYYIQLGLNDDMKRVDLFSTVLMLDVCFERRVFFGPFNNKILFIFLLCPLCCMNKTLSLPASEAGEMASMHFVLPVSLWRTKCAWQHAF